MNRNLLFAPLLLATGFVLADDVPEAKPVAETTAPDDATKAEHDEDVTAVEAQAKGEAKLISGMSILGNQEAPKSLVIVPWKSSVLGDSLGISTMFDDSKQPIDKAVFMRALSYYEIRSETRP